MNPYSLAHLSDAALLRDLATHDAGEHEATALVLAHIAEVEARKLFLSEGYPSMLDYCVHRLHRTEQAASKRLRVARAAREFPAIFPAVADGRLHLTGALLLVPKLTAENAGELVAAAAHKTVCEIERLLAERFPRQDVAARLETIPAAVQLSSRTVESPDPQLSSRTVEPSAPPARMTPLSPQKFALQATLEQRAHDNLRYSQALLGHEVRPGDIAAVLDLALQALVTQLEKRKFGATKNPRPGRRSTSGRYIPVEVKRRVWERDGAQCAFVSDKGQRCPAHARLEFDHILEVARGGESTVDNIRLLCRAHNQYKAERTFGAGFMDHKREESRRKTAEARAEKERARAAEAEQARARAAAEAEVRAQAAEQAQARANEVIPYLRALRFSAAEARLAAAPCEAIPDAPLEECVRLALSSTPLRGTVHGAAQSPGSAA